MYIQAMQTHLAAFEPQEALYVSAFIIYLLDRIWSHFKGKKKPLYKALENEADINDIIYPLLNNLMIDFNAIRVYLLQFHNGEHYYSGQDILKMTITHEVKRSNQKKIRLAVQGVLVDEHTHNVASRLRVENVVQINDIVDLKDEDLRIRYQYLGVSSMCCFGIRDNKKRVIAILCMQFNHRNPLNDNEVQGVRYTTYEISNALTNEES